MKSERNRSWIFIYIIYSSVMAIVGTLRVYPFIGLADGFNRWNLAIELLNSGKISTETLLSPMISVFQAITYSISQSYGLYTIIQGLTFYLSIGLLYYVLLHDLQIVKVPIWFVAAFITILIPTYRIFPLMLTDSSPLFVILVLIIYFVSNSWNLTSKKGVFIAILISILVFLAIAIRVNSLVLFFFLFLFCLITIKRNNTLVLTIALTVGIILGVFIPKLMVPNNSNAFSLGMIWELVAIEKDTGDEQLKDDLSAFGNVQEGIERWNPDYVNAVVWDNNPPFYAVEIAKSENTSRITKIYLKTFLRMPSEFIKNKCSYTLRTMGISHPLMTSARGVHGIDDITMGYGGMITQIQNTDRSSFIQVTDSLGVFTLKPWTLMLIYGLLILIGRLLGVGCK